MLFVAFSISSSAQERTSRTDFFFDAIVFRSEDGGGRMDVLVMVPYQSLQFNKNGNNFISYAKIDISILDSANKKIREQSIDDKIIAKDYIDAYGGNAGYKSYQEFFFLPPGNYSISINVTDKGSQKVYTRSRSLSVLDFDSFQFSLSGVMMLSSIEEQGGRMIITPFLTDNVAALKEGFFLFFESYDKNNLDKVDFVWELKNSASKIIQQSKKVVRTLDSSTSRHYLKVGPLQNIGAGAYTLQLIALKHTDNDMFSKDDYLAIAERSIRFEQTLGGTAVPELSKAIKQLRYVTDQDTIDYILSATNEEDKQNRFMEFWYNLDPTPNSERNEAYEEFYSRVSYANSNFRSYNEGWMTDKGMVYIIYGPPMNMEKYPSNAGDNRVYERWAYSNNREFIFLDNTGFGDYRLVRPMGVSDKYEFNK